MSLLDVLYPRFVEVCGAKKVSLMPEEPVEADRKKRWKLQNRERVRKHKRDSYRRHAKEINFRRRQKYAQMGVSGNGHKATEKPMRDGR